MRAELELIPNTHDLVYEKETNKKVNGKFLNAKNVLVTVFCRGWEAGQHSKCIL